MNLAMPVVDVDVDVDVEILNGGDISNGGWIFFGSFEHGTAALQAAGRANFYSKCPRHFVTLIRDQHPDRDLTVTCVTRKFPNLTNLSRKLRAQSRLCSLQHMLQPSIRRMLPHTNLVIPKRKLNWWATLW